MIRVDPCVDLGPLWISTKNDPPAARILHAERCRCMINLQSCTPKWFIIVVCSSRRTDLFVYMIKYLNMSLATNGYQFIQPQDLLRLAKEL
jgi:hypothetical protein